MSRHADISDEWNGSDPSLNNSGNNHDNPQTRETIQLNEFRRIRVQGLVVLRQRFDVGDDIHHHDSRIISVIDNRRRGDIQCYLANWIVGSVANIFALSDVFSVRNGNPRRVNEFDIRIASMVLSWISLSWRG